MCSGDTLIDFFWYVLSLNLYALFVLFVFKKWERFSEYLRTGK